MGRPRHHRAPLLGVVLGLGLVLGGCARSRPPAEVVQPTPAWKSKQGRIDAQLELTRALLDAGAPEQALVLIRQVREEGNSTEELEVLHARALRQLGLLDDAQNELVALTDRHPRNAQIHEELGILHMDSQDPEAAIAAFERAVELEPEDPDAWNNLGFALMSAGRPEEAIEPLRKALSLDATRARTRNNLGYALVAAGRDDEALRVFKANGRAATAWYQLGTGLELRGDDSGAIDAYRKSISLEPGHTLARQALTRLQASPEPASEEPPETPPQELP